MTVRASGQSEAQNQAAIAAAFDVVAELDRVLHPQRLGSDIAAINTAGIGVFVPVREVTAKVLRLAVDVFEASSGIFDPCLPTSDGTFASLEITPTHVVVKDCMSLDLGGIAKGFAVDEALARLKLRGCISGSINVGGEVAAFGEPEMIALQRPDGSRAPFELANEAVATTDATSSSRPSEHRGYYQRDAERLRTRDYAAIAAPSAAIADALTKCALFSSDEDLIALLARFHARVV